MYTEATGCVCGRRPWRRGVDYDINSYNVYLRSVQQRLALIEARRAHPVTRLEILRGKDAQAFVVRPPNLPVAARGAGHR